MDLSHTPEIDFTLIDMHGADFLPGIIVAGVHIHAGAIQTCIRTDIGRRGKMYSGQILTDSCWEFSRAGCVGPGRLQRSVLIVALFHLRSTYTLGRTFLAPVCAASVLFSSINNAVCVSVHEYCVKFAGHQFFYLLMKTLKFQCELVRARSRDVRFHTLITMPYHYD